MKTNNTAKKFGVGCCGTFGAAFLILACGIAARWSSGVRMPGLVVPAKALPTPNAFQTYVCAGQLVVNGNKISAAMEAKSQSTEEQREALVTSNAPALAMLRSGFSQEYMDASPRNMYAATPYFAKYRGLARLLMLEGSVRARKGDWSGAVDSGLDSIRLGEDTARNASLIGMLVGIACQAIGRRSLWGYVDHLDARQSRAAARRLESIRSRHFDYAGTLREESYISISSLKLLLKDSQSVGSAFLGQGNSMTNLGYYLMFVRYSKESIARNNQQYYEIQIANAGKPFAMHPAPPPVPKDPINQILMFDLDDTREKDVNAETQNALLMVTLALHAYHLEHGSYPKTLQELAPAYLTAIPDDPFAPTGPYQYRLNGGKYLLYSVGPDGIDDGGRAIDDPGKASAVNDSNYRYYTFAASKGDIVAGKNRW